MAEPTIDIYEAKDGWRWRLVATNKRIIADSGESYTTSTSARRAVKRFLVVVAKMAAKG